MNRRPLLLPAQLDHLHICATNMVHEQLQIAYHDILVYRAQRSNMCGVPGIAKKALSYTLNLLS